MRIVRACAAAIALAATWMLVSGCPPRRPIPAPDHPIEPQAEPGGAEEQDSAPEPEGRSRRDDPKEP